MRDTEKYKKDYTYIGRGRQRHTNRKRNRKTELKNVGK